MQNLEVLQLKLHKEDFDESYMKKRYLQLHICKMPSLKVLEVDVHCNLSLFMNPRLLLERLVVIAAGALQVMEELRCEELPTPMISPKQMYIHSGVAFYPLYRKYLKSSVARVRWSGAELLGLVREGQDSWTAAIPAKCEPSSLQECCCNACFGCLERAGVPIPCY